MPFKENTIAENPAGDQKIFKAGRWHPFNPDIQPDYLKRPDWESVDPVEYPYLQGTLLKTKPEGGVFSRFMSGVAENIPGLEEISTIAQAIPEAASPVVFEKDGSIRLSKGMQLIRDMLVSSGRGQMEQFRQARVAAKKGNLIEAWGRAKAGMLPFYGEGAVSAGERIGRGDVAGGLGEATGLIVPFLRPLKIAAQVRPFRAVAEARRATQLSKAGEQLQSLLLPKKGEAAKIVEKGTESILKGLVPHPYIGGLRAQTTRKHLLSRAEKQLKVAGEKLDELYDAAHEAGQTVDLRPAGEAVRRSVKTLDLPKLVQQNLEFPGGQRAFRDASTADRIAFIEMAEQQFNRKIDIMPTAFPEALVAARKQANWIEELSEQYANRIPVKQARIIMQQAGDRASGRGAFTRSATEDIASEAAASRSLRAEVSNILKKDIKGLKEANLSSSQWQTVKDALIDVIDAERRRPNPASFQVMLMRLGMGSILGVAGGSYFGLAGAGAGGLLGSTAGLAFGMFHVARDIIASPLWRVSSARTRLLIADSVGSGLLARGTIGGQAVSISLAEEKYPYLKGVSFADEGDENTDIGSGG